MGDSGLPFLFILYCRMTRCRTSTVLHRPPPPFPLRSKDGGGRWRCCTSNLTVADISIVQSRVLTGQSVAFTEKENFYEWDCRQISGKDSPLIIELKVSRNLTSKDILREQPVAGVFADEKTYGKRLCSHPVTYSRETIIDLKGEKKLKGLQMISSDVDKGKQLTISLSKDGENWEHYQTETLNGSIQEIPITTYVAGILVEGIVVQKIRLQFGEEVVKTVCHVYGD